MINIDEWTDAPELVAMGFRGVVRPKWDGSPGHYFVIEPRTGGESS